MSTLLATLVVEQNLDTHKLLVLAPNAGLYLPLLQELSNEGVGVSTAETLESALEFASSYPVILGQPDLVVKFLAVHPGVDWVQSTWAGVTPLLAMDRRDFLLSGVKNTFGPQIAEYVLAYLLAHELKLLERLGRQAHLDWWSEPSGTLAGKTMGVMGTGSIGQYIATMASAFGIRVVGLNRSGRAVDGFETVCPVERLPEFLSGLDYLVCTLPETAATRGLLDERAFAAIRPGCYLINVGRGSTIDEAALLEALHDGRLNGALLDVFCEEPLASDSPLWHAPETLITAHVAAKSHPADIAKIFVANYRRYGSGRKLNYLVDYDRGY